MIERLHYMKLGTAIWKIFKTCVVIQVILVALALLLVFLNDFVF